MSVSVEPKMTQPSVNGLVKPLVHSLLDNAVALRLGVERMENGATLVDAGISSPGGLEAGRLIAEICLGGLGKVILTHDSPFERWPLMIHVHSLNPVLACLGSQYAGWSLSHGEGKGAFHALGSGPARALAQKEPLYKELDYQDSCDSACIILEVDTIPPLPLIDKIANSCGISAEALTVILTPTRSLAGSVQVVARVLEVALHKTHELGFPLDHVVDGMGSAPLCPPAPDFVKAMGRTNDAILFAGRVQLFVNGTNDAAKDLAEKLPSSSSRDYGSPFAEVFKTYKYDFFQIDPMLFSPAVVSVSALESGQTFHAGKLDLALLEASFGSH